MRQNLVLLKVVGSLSVLFLIWISVRSWNSELVGGGEFKKLTVEAILPLDHPEMPELVEADFSIRRFAVAGDVERAQILTLRPNPRYQGNRRGRVIRWEVPIQSPARGGIVKVGVRIANADTPFVVFPSDNFGTSLVQVPVMNLFGGDSPRAPCGEGEVIWRATVPREFQKNVLDDQRYVVGLVGVGVKRDIFGEGQQRGRKVVPVSVQDFFGRDLRKNQFRWTGRFRVPISAEDTDVQGFLMRAGSCGPKSTTIECFSMSSEYGPHTNPASYPLVLQRELLPRRFCGGDILNVQVLFWNSTMDGVGVVTNYVDKIRK